MTNSYLHHTWPFCFTTGRQDLTSQRCSGRERGVSAMNFPSLAKNIVTLFWGVSHQDTEGRHLKTRVTLVMVSSSFSTQLCCDLLRNSSREAHPSSSGCWYILFFFFFFLQPLLPLPPSIQHAVHECLGQTWLLGYTDGQSDGSRA